MAVPFCYIHNRMLDFPIISKLGGTSEAHRKIAERGFEGSVNAMGMWRVRGRIPGEPTRLLMQAAEADGIQSLSSDFELAELPDPVAA